MLFAARVLVAILGGLLVALAIAGAIVGGDDGLAWTFFLAGVVCAGVAWAAGLAPSARDPLRRKPARW